MSELGIPYRCRGCNNFFKDFEELKELQNYKTILIKYPDKLPQQIDGEHLDLLIEDQNTKILDVESRIENKQAFTVGCPGAKIYQVVIDDEYISVISCQSPLRQIDKPS